MIPGLADFSQGPRGYSAVGPPGKNKKSNLASNIPKTSLEINLYIARFHQMRNSRDCRTVVTDRNLIFGTKIALGLATNEKSPKSENVAMVTQKYGNAELSAPFGPEGIIFGHQMS